MAWRAVFAGAAEPAVGGALEEPPEPQPQQLISVARWRDLIALHRWQHAENRREMRTVEQRGFVCIAQRVATATITTTNRSRLPVPAWVERAGEGHQLAMVGGWMVCRLYGCIARPWNGKSGLRHRCAGRCEEAVVEARNRRYAR